NFTLPFSLEYKEFISETIPLDARNTSIKTDTSSTRMQQINKLNAILGTINKDHVYQTTEYIPPTTSTRRTSYFADRRVYKYTDGNSSTSLHYGTDYGIPTGSKVNACATGLVVMAENRISTGWSVVIEHLPGLYSLYYHLDELNVKEGDIVNQGTLIGLSGATGLATGPHLHWEMRLNMSAVNPDFFTQDFTFASEQ
ncbi:MAG: M23 family metallopeptidase, partial [Treponema sp.]|nr:M23 family metallopeptidase [Treponema sp.]